MKFFTHDWAGEAVPAKYQAHLSTLLPRMPATIRALAQGVNIHDGRLRAATLDRARHTLALSMRCGDNQVGYFDLDLVYYEAVLRDKDVAALREVSRDLKAEAQYDELDLTDAGAWLHRMTFWRDHEVTVCFGRLALRLQPMPNRDFLRLPDVYVEVRSDAPFPGTGSLVGASRAGRLGYPLSVSPTILRVRGFRFYFFSREERRAHVHVQHADGEAKFRIEPAVELHGNYGLKPKQIAEAENLIKEHLNEIRRAWATHFPG